MTNSEILKKYEDSWDFKIPPHMSVIIRVDGKNFSRITKELNKPFDPVFHAVMDNTMVEVSKEIDGCKLAYCQSDEVTFILNNVDNQTLYFNGRIQKIVSIVAASMSVKFYRNLMQYILEYQDYVQDNIDNYSEEDIKKLNDRVSILWRILDECPIFDARVYVMPNDEEIDILMSRQFNSLNNSILSVGQQYLGKKTCEGLSKNNLIIRLANEGYDIDEILTDRDKYGSIAFKDEEGKWTVQVAAPFNMEVDKECNTET